jgi:MYXO-CTERM domain-containing protein
MPSSRPASRARVDAQSGADHVLASAGVRRLIGLLFVVSLGLSAARARANGALPATIQVLLPAAAPKTIVVSTNFGLVTSTDAGTSWSWTCEHDLGMQGSAYQMGAPPTGRLLALATAGLVESTDLACGWSLVMDDQTAYAEDYFPDPADPTRVLVLGILRSQQRAYAVLELKLPPSGPGTITTLYTPPVGDELTTVEVARSNRQIIYATIRAPNGVDPARVIRTEDGGKTWTESKPDPTITDLGILAVDNMAPNTIYFRVRGTDGDELWVSRDGGKTVTKVMAPMLVMSAFVQLPNGHVLVGWLDIDRGYLDRSTDSGATFSRLSTQLHPKSLAERGGKLYMALDFLVDGDALSVSSDEGATWSRAMGLDQVVAAASCAAARSACVSQCQALVKGVVFMPKACAPLSAPGDAGPPAASDASVAVDARVAADAATKSPPPPPAGGCACAIGSGERAGGGLFLGAALALVMRLRRRRKAGARS